MTSRLLFTLTAVGLALIATPSKAVTYNDGESCPEAGAAHWKKDAQGAYYLICNGSTWESVYTVSIDENMGIGTTNPSSGLKLDVEGNVGATEYCDETGANCFDHTDVGGGSTTVPGVDRQVIINDGGSFGAVYNFVVVDGGAGGAGGDITTGLVNHWAFNDGSGTTAIDSAGSNNGTLVNGPTWRSGKIGNALTFDGTSDYVNVTSSGASTGTNQPKTFSAWTYKTSHTAAGSIVYQVKGGNEGFYFGTQTSIATSNHHIFTDRVNAVNNIIVTGTEIPPLNQWNHLVLSMDSSKNWKYYLNGSLKKQGTFSEDITLNSSQINIGALFEAGVFFDGSIDDVRIYNRALSATDVLTLFEVGEPPTGGLAGAVGIGDLTPASSLLLDVEGPVGATEYCNEDGNTCFSRVSVPASSSSTCSQGDFAFDSSYYYICHTANTWRRAAISTW